MAAKTQSGVTSYLVTIALPSAPGVQPGMTATANIVYAQQSDALLVPNRALRRQGNDQVVDVLTPGGEIEPRPVQRGITDEQMTEITAGLDQGDQVVVVKRFINLSAPPSTPRSAARATAWAPRHRVTKARQRTPETANQAGGGSRA